MSMMKYPQVYGPDGKWIGTFYTRDSAVRWINGREGYEITDRRPTLEERTPAR